MFKSLFLFSLLVCVPSVSAAEYFVRYTTGGSSSACTGLANVAYDGSGSGEACAFQDIRDAITAATWGDFITIEKSEPISVGLFFEYNLTAKGSPPTSTDADYITIRSSGYASLPIGRVGVSDTANMAKIQTTLDKNQTPQFLFATNTNAKYWKLQGLNLTDDGVADTYINYAVSIGGNYGVDHIWIDRCYIHPSQDGDSTILPRNIQVGVVVGTNPGTGTILSNVKITNSRLSGWGGTYPHSPNEVMNSQAIQSGLINGLTLTNNFISSTNQPWFPGPVDSLNASTATVSAGATTTTATLSDTTGISVGTYLAFEQPSGEQAQGRVTIKAGNDLTFTDLVRVGSAPSAPATSSNAYWNGENSRNFLANLNTFDIDPVLADNAFGHSGNLYLGNADDVSNTITNITHADGNDLVNGLVVFFAAPLPGGVSAWPSRYYTVNVSGTGTQTVQVSATVGGAAINLTSDTTATKIRIAGSNPKGYIEFKGGVNIEMVGNVLQGYPAAIGINSANQNGGTPWALVSNLDIHDNWFKDFGYVLVSANGNANAAPGTRQSAEGTDNFIRNNLFTRSTALVSPFTINSIGSISNGDNFQFTHNTVAVNPAADDLLISSFSTPTNFLLQDNIIWIGQAFGGSGFTTYFSGTGNTENKNAVINNNVHGRSDADILSWMPNSYVSSASQFPLTFIGSDPTVLTDWRLAVGSVYRAGGARDASDNTDNGVSIDALLAALVGNDGYASAAVTVCKWSASPACQ